MKINLLLMTSFLFLCACSSKSDKAAIGEVIHCADPEAEEVGIIGGQVLSGNSRVAKGTVFILTSLLKADGGIRAQSVCTGSVLDHSVVLTAGHCVDRDFGKEVKVEASDSIEVFVSTRSQPLCDRATLFNSMTQAQNVEMHSEWIATGESSDLALLKLAKPLEDVKPFLISQQFLNPLYHRPYVVGFGVTTDYADSSDRSPIVLRFVELMPMSEQFVENKLDKKNRNWREQMSPEEKNKVEKEKKNYSDYYKEYAPVLVFNQVMDKGMCSGDSGGPTLVVKDKQAYLIGVNAWVNQEDKKGPGSCRYTSGSTSVFAYKSWIVQKYQKLMSLKSTDPVPFLR